MMKKTIWTATQHKGHTERFAKIMRQFHNRKVKIKLAGEFQKVILPAIKKIETLSDLEYFRTNMYRGLRIPNEPEETMKYSEEDEMRENENDTVAVAPSLADQVRQEARTKIDYNNNYEQQEECSNSKAQWIQTEEDIFIPMTGTVKKNLPPGLYTSQISQDQFRLIKIELVHDELLRLPDSVGEQIINSIQHFWESRDQFKKRKQIYKRGILICSAPGAGKSATLTLLAEDLIKKGGIVFIPHRDSASLIISLRVIRQIEKNRPIIILLEDLDELVIRGNEHELLSLLDGEHQFDNVVYLGTTNYPERLGPRLVNRPSRFDEVITMPMPSAKNRREYLEKKMLPEDKQKFNIDQWVIDTEGLSIAHIRELLVATTCLNRPYDETILRLKNMCASPPEEIDPYMEKKREAGFGLVKQPYATSTAPPPTAAMAEMIKIR